MAVGIRPCAPHANPCVIGPESGARVALQTQICAAATLKRRLAVRARLNEARLFESLKLPSPSAAEDPPKAPFAMRAFAGAPLRRWILPSGRYFWPIRDNLLRDPTLTRSNTTPVKIAL